MTKKIDYVNRLAKWRGFFAGWQLGTRTKEDPEANAVRDHREVTMLLRAENNALVALLVRKGIFTAEEFSEEFNDQCGYLCEAYADRYPGIIAVDHGLRMDERAVETMARMNFKP